MEGGDSAFRLFAPAHWAVTDAPLLQWCCGSVSGITVHKSLRHVCAAPRLFLLTPEGEG
jgi:hypothetical protein